MVPSNNGKLSSASGIANPVKPAPKNAPPGFGTRMPKMSSAFDTAMWLNAA